MIGKKRWALGCVIPRGESRNLGPLLTTSCIQGVNGYTVFHLSLQPVVAWTKDGKAPDTKKDKDGKAHFEIKEEGGNYCLAINGVTMDDKGKYQAVFTNRAGEVKTAASLNVLCEWKFLPSYYG